MPSQVHNVVVLSNDHGIRPAGRPDACFYCDRNVGKVHGQECVAVRRVIKAKLTMSLSSGETLIRNVLASVPSSWDREHTLFHFNHGTFCLDNFLEDLLRFEPEDAEVAALVESFKGTDRCACAHGVVDLASDWDDLLFLVPQDVVDPLRWFISRTMSTMEAG